MDRRQFLSASLLVPASFALGSLPALAGTQGSTLLQAPGYSSSGSFDIPTYTPGTRGHLDMVFTNGPRVAAQFGPNAVQSIAGSQAGDRISVLYVGFAGNDAVASTWTLTQASAAGARAQFSANGLTADVSAIVGGDRYAGAGLAAMLIAAISGGASFRQSSASRLQAAVTPRNVGGNFAFGLEVTVRPA